MKRCEGEHLQSENFSYDNKKKSWAFKNQKQLFSKMSWSVPLELAALRGLLAHGCFSCFWASKQGPDEDPGPGSGVGASGQRSFQQAPEGAVFLGGAGAAACSK